MGRFVSTSRLLTRCLRSPWLTKTYITKLRGFVQVEKKTQKVTIKPGNLFQLTAETFKHFTKKFGTQNQFLHSKELAFLKIAVQALVYIELLSNFTNKTDYIEFVKGKRTKR